MTVTTYDVVVWGATPAGVMAAQMAALNGCSVVVLQPDTHLGGALTSGLNLTDLGQAGDSIVGGLTRQLFNAGGTLYGVSPAAWLIASNSWKGTSAGYRVAIVSALATSGITVVTGAAPNIPFVTQDTTTLDLTRVSTSAGDFYATDAYIDASDEGTLIVNAPGTPLVSLSWGRDANATYGERWNGWQAPAIKRTAALTALDTNGQLYYTIKRMPLGWADGTEWNQYSNPTSPIDGWPDMEIDPPEFRMNIAQYLTQQGSLNGQTVPNQIPWPQPPVYRPDDYALFYRRQVYADGQYNDLVDSTHQWIQRMIGIAPIYLPPNYGTSAILYGTNGGNGFSVTKKDGMTGFPLATWQQQRAIIDTWANWQMGFLYAGANYSSSTPAIIANMATFGLDATQFPSTDCYTFQNATSVPGWPAVPYIRECVRMIGKRLGTEWDVLVPYGTTVPDPICFGSYNLDCHSTSTRTDKSGLRIFFEGMIERSVWDDPVAEDYKINTPVAGTYQISLDTIRAHPLQCPKLLVPVCSSETHAYFSSARMLNTQMMKGEAAGAVAAAVRAARVAGSPTTPAAVPYSSVLPYLTAQNARLDWSYVSAGQFSYTNENITLLTDSAGNALLDGSGNLIRRP